MERNLPLHPKAAMSETLGVIPEQLAVPANDRCGGLNILEDDPEHKVDTQASPSESTEDDRLSPKDVPEEAYKVTLILVTRQGALVTKVLDTRSDDIEETWDKMKKSESSKEIVYRLLLAEDLPRATERQLEKLLEGDRRLLIDHAANKCISFLPSWREERLKTEFHMNISEPPAAISVALPYEVHGTTEEPVDLDCGSLDLRLARRNYQRLQGVLHSGERRHHLRKAWLGLGPCEYGIQRFLYIAYRRISLQFITTPCQESPMCTSSLSLVGALCSIDIIKVSS